MTSKFQNKYRIESARWQKWDYGWPAAYFVTICTKNRESYFGNVVDGKMVLSGMGIIADIMWQETVHHPGNIEMGEFVVMPNHVHGILIIKEGDGMAGSSRNGPGAMPGKNEFMAKISPKKGSLSAIIRSYKSAVSRHCHRLGFDFDWQTRFHDHIIRDDQEYEKIKTYIQENPERWIDDKFYN